MSTINPTMAAAATVGDTPALLKAFRAVKDTVREKHPFERKSTLLRPHPVAWGKYLTHFKRTATFYVPAAMLVFGWPMAMKWVINYSNGVYDKPTKRGR